jgi:hypothetical protein
MGEKVEKKATGQNGRIDCYRCTSRLGSLYRVPRDLRVLPNCASFDSAGVGSHDMRTFRHGPLRIIFRVSRVDRLRVVDSTPSTAAQDGERVSNRFFVTVNLRGGSHCSPCGLAIASLPLDSEARG